MITVRKHEIKEILNTIYLDITNNLDKKQDIGLLSGEMGEVLFLFYYGCFLRDNNIFEVAEQRLKEVLIEVNNGYEVPTFCSGVAGIGWAIELLNTEGLIEIDTDVFLDPIDTFVIESIDLFRSHNKFDFLHGYTGQAYYILKRYETTKFDQKKRKFSMVLFQIIKELENLFRKEEFRSEWITKNNTKGFGVDLGMAHGITGVLNLLSRIAETPCFFNICNQLMQKMGKYLLDGKKLHGNKQSVYPNFFSSTGQSSGSSRLAWCYGDMGIGITFYRVGMLTKNDFFLNEALDILKLCAKRRNLESTGVKDPGLCHGAFGIMHMYNVLYQDTKCSDFRSARDFWINKGLGMRMHNNMFSGFNSLQVSKEGKWFWNPETDLLDGISGIGLSLISYLTSKKLHWDQCLLIG